MASRNKKGLMAEMNVVPYIDVMLVLLVIFMITSPLMSRGVEVNLPQANANPLNKQEQKEPIVITVDAQGRWYLNTHVNQKAPLDSLALSTGVGDAMRKHPGAPILVSGDASVAYGRVVEAMVVLNQAGVPNVGLLTDLPDDQRGKRP